MAVATVEGLDLERTGAIPGSGGHRPRPGSRQPRSLSGCRPLPPPPGCSPATEIRASPAGGVVASRSLRLRQMHPQRRRHPAMDVYAICIIELVPVDGTTGSGAMVSSHRGLWSAR